MSVQFLGSITLTYFLLLFGVAFSLTICVGAEKVSSQRDSLFPFSRRLLHFMDLLRSVAGLRPAVWIFSPSISAPP